MNYSKANNPLLHGPATGRVGRTFWDCSSHAAGPAVTGQEGGRDWVSDIKASWKKRILSWFLKEVETAALYQGFEASSRRNGIARMEWQQSLYSSMSTETAGSSKPELQPTSHTFTDLLHSDRHKTRCPGLPASRTHCSSSWESCQQAAFSCQPSQELPHTKSHINVRWRQRDKGQSLSGPKQDKSDGPNRLQGSCVAVWLSLCPSCFLPLSSAGVDLKCSSS